MNSIEATVSATVEQKQSKFIAHLVPYPQFKEMLNTLELAHPKARHFVTAFRYMNSFDQVVEGCSDDNEPKNTAGKPTLSVLQGHALINCAIITVRYFGGTKLGTGGLVRAYGDAANAVINAALLIPYEKLEAVTFLTPFDSERKIYYHCEKLAITVAQKQYTQDGVQWSFELSAPQKEALLHAISAEIS